MNGETGATVGTVDVSNTIHTNAGTYNTDSWTFTGTANYNNIAAQTITDVINKADAVVVVTPYTVTYDGLPHTATVTSITGVNGETGATVGTVDVSNTIHTNAGTYNTDSWTFTGTANYNNIAAQTITDVISKANATVVVTPYDVVYDGQPHTATVTSITGVNMETGATVGTVDVSGTTHTNAGSYLADPWTFTGTANYNNSNGTVDDFIRSGTVSGRVLLAIPLEGSAPVPLGSLTPTPTPVGVPSVTLTAHQTSSILPDFSVSTLGFIPPSPTPTPSPVDPADYGKYTLANFFGAGEYTVSPYKAPQPCTYPSPNQFDPPNGISSADASAVSRHIIGVAPLSQSALKAADVSDNAVVSAFDAGLIARKVAGICVPPNTSGEWRFVSLSTNGTPSPSPQFSNTVYSDLINQTYTNENYKAYMMGDVNGTWNPNQADATPDRPTAVDPNGPVASLPRVSVMPGGIITVPFNLNNLKGRGIENYQFDVVYDPEIVEPSTNGLAVELSGTSGQEFTVVSNVARPGLLKVVVYGAATAIGDGVYANLRFSAKGGLGSVSMLQIEGFQFNDGKVGVNTVDGSISLSQASAGEVISGRVLTPGGQSGLRNARVTVTSDTGEIFAATTGTFGYFQIGELTLGRTYIVAVESRRFRFTPVSVALVGNLAPIDLIGQE